MIKLHASVSKKVPIDGKEFSSQSFSAGMEIEIGDNTDGSAIQTKLYELYKTLEATVNAKVGGGAPQPDRVQAPTPPPARDLPDEAPKCPKCGRSMVLRQRKSDGNKFWGCTGFRDGCRGTQPVA